MVHQSVGNHFAFLLFFQSFPYEVICASLLCDVIKDGLSKMNSVEDVLMGSGPEGDNVL